MYVITDSNDLVLRFNNAPTEGYERDVGSKTTIRILNSQILAKSEFNFLKSPLYKNTTLLVWDPSNYSSTMQQVSTCVDTVNYAQYDFRTLEGQIPFLQTDHQLFQIYKFF